MSSHIAPLAPSPSFPMPSQNVATSELEKINNNNDSKDGEKTHNPNVE